MDFLIKLFTRRNLVLMVAAALLLVVGNRLKRYPLQCYTDWRYPPQKSTTAATDEILTQ